MSWDPLRDLRAWQDRLERLATTQGGDTWTPPVDIFETSDRYVISAELPGLAREAVELALENTRLTIRGVRADLWPGAADDTLHFHQVERGHGSFVRTFEFAQPIDVDAVAADLTSGVLTVTLPKVPAPAVRKIEVR